MSGWRASEVRFWQLRRLDWQASSLESSRRHVSRSAPLRVEKLIFCYGTAQGPGQRAPGTRRWAPQEFNIPSAPGSREWLEEVQLEGKVDDLNLVPWHLHTAWCQQRLPVSSRRKAKREKGMKSKKKNFLEAVVVVPAPEATADGLSHTVPSTRVPHCQWCSCFVLARYNPTETVEPPAGRVWGSAQSAQNLFIWHCALFKRCSIAERNS